MFKIKTFDKIDPQGLNKFSRENYEVASEIAHPDAILLRSYKLHNEVFPASVKAIARAGAGVNNVPVDACSERGIVVFNTPGANANAVKELTLAGLFLAARKVYRGIEWAKSIKDEGENIPQLVEKNKSRFKGTEIKGKTLGVIGLGAIGVMVANDASALGMKVVGYDPFISVNAAWNLSRRVKKASSFEALLKDVDYLSVHVPLTDQTKGVLNKEKFAMMKNGVKILNFSRGGLVNNADLKEALASGKVDRYVTDFPDEEVIGLENVVSMPHLGASTDEAETNCAIMAADQIIDFLENGNIVNSVNFPECTMPFLAEARITIMNKNIPNMISQITALLASEGVNISDMINKNKGDYAYNIIDINGAIPENIEERLRVIDGVLMARVITK
ncbi:MAG: phosphoglycerate dehydrogenase [Spirochaetales bacterium]|nr:phosphoglycerate dehydrogenase [Spirochaetales bacterium]